MAYKLSKYNIKKYKKNKNRNLDNYIIFIRSLVGFSRIIVTETAAKTKTLSMQGLYTGVFAHAHTYYYDVRVYFTSVSLYTRFLGNDK